VLKFCAILHKYDLHFGHYHDTLWVQSTYVCILQGVIVTRQHTRTHMCTALVDVSYRAHMCTASGHDCATLYKVMIVAHVHSTDFGSSALSSNIQPTLYQVVLHSADQAGMLHPVQIYFLCCISMSMKCPPSDPVRSESGRDPVGEVSSAASLASIWL
jgi:hypothetical protein